MTLPLFEPTPTRAVAAGEPTGRRATRAKTRSAGAWQPFHSDRRMPCMRCTKRQADGEQLTAKQARWRMHWTGSDLLACSECKTELTGGRA